MSNRAKIFIGLCAVAAWFGALALQHFGIFTEVAANRIVDAAWATLVGLGLLHAGGVGQQGKQGGFARPLCLLLVAASAAALLLAGCTTTTATLYAATETAAVKGIKAADDNLVATLKAATCGLPYSAIQRDATIAAAVDVMCGTLPRSTGAILATMSAADMAAVLQLVRSAGAVVPAPVVRP